VVTDGDTIRRVTPDGTVTTIAGVEGANGFVNGDGDVARFGSYLAGIAAGPSGVIYVSDTTNHAIRRIEGRTVSTFIAPPFFEVPMGIDTDAAGNVYMWDENVPSIYRITPEGVLTTVAHSDALLYAAQGVAVSPDGALYVASLRYHSIFRVLPGSQAIEHFAGSETSMGNVNGSREETRFRSPGRLDVAPDGRIFVRDANAAIRVASPGVPPEIDSFTADVLAIPEGGRATLSWTTRHGVVRLTPGGEVPATGTLEVQPSETTTYSLTASNEYGEVRRTVTIQAGVRKRRSTRS
jgi:sugar lactone lactonase YvrE